MRGSSGGVGKKCADAYPQVMHIASEFRGALQAVGLRTSVTGRRSQAILGEHSRPLAGRCVDA